MICCSKSFDIKEILKQNFSKSSPQKKMYTPEDHKKSFLGNEFGCEKVLMLNSNFEIERCQ